jgi:hypothetical protein
VNITSSLYKAARLSADLRAVRRGPDAVAKRVVRKAVGRSLARTGVFKWPS